MISANLAREQSKFNRDCLVSKLIISTLQEIEAEICLTIKKGETFFWIDTKNWVAGLDDAVAKELIKEGYCITIKTASCQIGISWTNA
jgi:hypothetical protein